MSHWLTAIVALTQEGVIGHQGGMPWQLSSDLRRFKRLTMGCPIIMGRKTYESIGRPLPGRETIVLSRDPHWQVSGVTVTNLEGAMQIVDHRHKAFVIGGAQIYQQLLEFCSEVMLTRVWSQVPGDTHLTLDLTGFKACFSERIPAGPQDTVPSEFQIYRRC